VGRPRPFRGAWPDRARRGWLIMTTGAK
jgi:hypothetical protein